MNRGKGPDLSFELSVDRRSKSNGLQNCSDIYCITHLFMTETLSPIKLTLSP